jgi:diguanylate cyclase (GGDEF)-like protein
MPQDKSKQLNILVVGNPLEDRETSSSYLLSKNSPVYRIIEAKCGAEGLIKYDLSQAELILFAHSPPDFDGLEFIKKLTNRTKDFPPIILVTKHESEANILTENLTENLTEKQKNVVYISSVDRLTVNNLKLLINRAVKQNNLQQQLEKNIWQQQLIADTALRIRKSLSLKFILKIATQEILDFLNCDRLSIVRFAQGDIDIEAQSLLNDTVNNHLPQLNATDFHPVQLDKIAIVVKTNQSRSQLYLPILLEQGINVSTHYPLWGWLIAEQQSPRQWEQQEQSFLEQFTIQISIALSQKLLYEQLKNLDRQLEITHVSNQHLKRLSLKDSLTKVYNRRYFKQQLNKEWFRLRRTKSSLSVILCDIDCFKLYNDTYGHQQGDFCLLKVAEVLSATLKRPADILARYGGEEFVAILPNTEEAGAIKVAEAMRISVKGLQIPHSSSIVSSMVTISIGVATTIPAAKDTPKMLIEAADDALYLAKNRGRDGVAVHQHAIAQSDYEQNHDREWADRIRNALDHNLFTLYAQTIASLKEDKRHHFEILLRLEDRSEQVFTPGSFFEVAERNCLMSSIDTWVINRLLEQLTNKGDSSYWQNYQFSVNLSGASLNDPSFLDFLSRRLAEHHLSPQLFCFEITEAIAVDNIQQISKFIVALKKLGCSFALDDFGKGMCSLTYLKNLPVDYLKIDGSFITELHKDKVSQVMVEAINHLAKGIGLKTVAEYVENQEILDALYLLDIDFAQGYHLGHPQKFAEIV